MNAPPHLDAGRIYRLAPFEEVVTELRKAFADSPGADGAGRPNAFERAVVPTQDAADAAVQPLDWPGVVHSARHWPRVVPLLGTGQSSMAGQGPYVLLGAGQSLAAALIPVPQHLPDEPERDFEHDSQHERNPPR